MTNPKDPKTTPTKACPLCTEIGHRRADCPYQASPTPLLSKLMAGLK